MGLVNGGGLTHVLQVRPQQTLIGVGGEWFDVCAAGRQACLNLLATSVNNICGNDEVMACDGAVVAGRSGEAYGDDMALRLWNWSPVNAPELQAPYLAWRVIDGATGETVAAEAHLAGGI